MDPIKRHLLLASAATAAAALLPARVGAADEPDADADDDLVMPALPAHPSPGRAGDFDFLAGRWHVRHRRRAPGSDAWDRFEGEATCWTVLDGLGSVEELRIPARHFSGMGLRLLDTETKRWADHWVNARRPVMGEAGQTGSFEQGAGLFSARDADEQGAYVVLGVWDRITPTGCRWRQAVSRDDGRTWRVDWIMAWRRVA